MTVRFREDEDFVSDHFGGMGAAVPPGPLPASAPAAQSQRRAAPLPRIGHSARLRPQRRRSEPGARRSPAHVPEAAAAAAAATGGQRLTAGDSPGFGHQQVRAGHQGRDLIAVSENGEAPVAAEEVGQFPAQHFVSAADHGEGEVRMTKLSEGADGLHDRAETQTAPHHQDPPDRADALSGAGQGSRACAPGPGHPGKPERNGDSCNGDQPRGDTENLKPPGRLRAQPSSVRSRRRRRAAKSAGPSQESPET